MFRTTLNLLTAAALATLSFNVVADDAAQLEKGKALFSGGAQPIACAVCHTLQDAGATGGIGPDLDELKPEADRIRKTMLEGMGAMPSFSDMDEDDREAIIAYVVEATN